MEKTKNKKQAKLAELDNGLASLAQNIAQSMSGNTLNGFESPFPNIPDLPISTGNTAPNLSARPLFYNNRYYLITQQRTLLTELYVEHALVQTLVDLPVEDALLRERPKLISTELDDDELQQLENEMDKLGIIEKIADAFRWTRLFGGAGIIINELRTDPREEFNIDKIKKKDKVEFYVADRWELANTPYVNAPTLGNQDGLATGVNFDYYGTPVNPSRVLILKGKEAPSIRRQQLSGWGMSEVERLVAPLNKYMKNQNVIYELIDEAKIDVYSLQNYRSAIYAGQEQNVQKAIMWSNMMKNYLNAMILDKEDAFDQKQMNFSGLAEILRESYLDVASAVRMPITKLFGLSASGFNSGEDDIENYNSMIEREVRYKSKNAIITIGKILCKVLFGEYPDDLDVEFPSLRVLKQLEEEQKATSIFSRVQQMYDAGLITQGEYYNMLAKENVIKGELKIKDSDEYKDLMGDDYAGGSIGGDREEEEAETEELEEDIPDQTTQSKPQKETIKKETVKKISESL